MPGLRVVLHDLSDVVVSDAVDYIVDDEGALLVHGSDRVVRRFDPGTWVEVRTVAPATPLRDDWPPENLDALMDTVLRELVVTYGLGGYEISDRRSRYASPLLNDFDAFVGALMDDEGMTPPHERRERAWFEDAVGKTFGVAPPRRDSRHR